MQIFVPPCSWVHTVVESILAATGLGGGAEHGNSVSAAPHREFVTQMRGSWSTFTPEPMIWVCRDDGTVHSSPPAVVICTRLLSLILSI